VFALGLDELAGVEGLNESILRGFMEHDMYVPGLADVVTVFSHLGFDEEARDEMAGEEEEFESPFDSGSRFDDEEEGEGEDGGGTDGESADSGGAAGEGQSQGSTTNHGRVNVNTVPLCVLAALMPSEDIPFSVMEKIDEFRRLALEEDKSANLVFGDEKSRFDLDRDDEDGDGESDEEEDYIFRTPDEVLSRVEEYFNQSFDLTEEAREEFAANLVVKSHVFTILVEVRKQNQQAAHFDGSGDRPPPDRVYRAVVWRRVSADGGVQAITVVPLHLWAAVLPPTDEDYQEEHPWGF